MHTWNKPTLIKLVDLLTLRVIHLKPDRAKLPK